MGPGPPTTITNTNELFVPTRHERCSSNLGRRDTPTVNVRIMAEGLLLLFSFLDTLPHINAKRNIKRLSARAFIAFANFFQRATLFKLSQIRDLIKSGILEIQILDLTFPV